MGLNKGHKISVENLEVVRITHRRVILKGECGLSIHITPEDWPKLRTRIERAMRIARQQQKHPDEILAEQMQKGLEASLASDMTLRHQL